jgi:hypothetical protein
MCRKVVGPIICCLLLSWGVLAAPRKDNPLPVYYEASTIGDKLVFEEDYGGHSREWGLEVTDARQRGAALIVTMQWADGDETPTMQFEVSEKGLCRLEKGDAGLETPECYLRLPFKKGETWELTRTRDGETFTTKCTAADEEEIEVPAGRFRCVRIESEYVFKGISCKVTYWMAPHCGMVKEVLVGTDKVGTDYRRKRVLKSFTPAGK